MNIYKKFILFLLVAFVFVQCSNDNQYIIEKGKVGLLTKETTIKDLNTIFEQDSIVSQFSENILKPEEGDEISFFGSSNDEYEVFSKDGQKLLEIVPVNQNDSTSKLKSIQIFNPSYKTAKGIGLLSTFKDIKNSYMINKIETTLSSATLYIDELNATIAIDKDDLGINKFSSEEIDIDQIPDISTIKYFTIWFN